MRRSGRHVTDVYFARTLEIQAARRGETVTAEVVLKSFPSGWGWGVLAGIDEVATLLRDLPVSVRAFPEGAIFGTMQPVLMVEGRYVDFAQYETALLGLLCQASGVATKAARCKKAAGEHPVVSFGARRMHPALAPMIERNPISADATGCGVRAPSPALDFSDHAPLADPDAGRHGGGGAGVRRDHRSRVRRVVLDRHLGDEVEAGLVAGVARPPVRGRLDTPAAAATRRHLRRLMGARSRDSSTCSCL
jgi:hypothetical protein